MARAMVARTLVLGLALALCHAPLPAAGFVSSAASRSRNPRAPALRVLRDLRDTGADNPWDDGRRRREGDDVLSLGQSFDIHDMLLQRSVQTLFRYLTETRNEVKAQWLLGFLNHTHLDDGMRWHSVIGLRRHFTDYFRHLILEPVLEIQVRYEVGRPDGWTEPANEEAGLGSDGSGRGGSGGGAGNGGAHPDLTPWMAAASSRRRNPFLQQKQYREYTETIDPSQVASSLMAVCSHLSREWREDLALLSASDSNAVRSEDKRRERDFTKYCREHPEDDICQIKLENLQAPVFETAERGREDSTPLRRLNFELLQRAATIVAVKAMQTDLAFEAMSCRQSAADLEWFDRFVDEWWPRLAEVSSSRRRDGGDVALEAVANELLVALQHRPPVLREAGVLVDPPRLAERLFGARERACQLLARQLEDTDAVMDAIRRECSQRAMLERLMALDP